VEKERCIPVLQDVVFIFSYAHFDSTLVNPGLSTVIDPAQMHIVLLDSNIAGFPPIFSFFAAGSQGINGKGIHDDGTNTGTGPAIFQFMGLAGELQLPKAGTFSMGMKSI
jgi:hypothetical protein